MCIYIHVYIYIYLCLHVHISTTNGPMGKSTISMAIFNSKPLVYQRVYSIKWTAIPLIPMKSH